MKKLKLGLLLSMLFGCTSNNYKQMNMNEGISAYKNDENAILLDVRRNDEYNSGHIPGSIHYANEDIDENIYHVLSDKNQTIYVYCRSGNRSKQAAKKLVDLGYVNVIEIGGILDYKGELE